MVNSYRDKISKIPAPLRSFLESDELVAILENISTIAQLDQQQTGQLTFWVGQVLLGELPFNQFKQTLENAPIFSPNQVIMINDLVNSKIFNPWKPYLEHTLTTPLSTLPTLTTPVSQLKPVTLPQQPTTSRNAPPTSGTKKPTQEPNITTLPPNDQAPTPLINKNSLPLKEGDQEPMAVSIESPRITQPDIKPVNIPNVSRAEREEMQNKLLAAIQGNKEKFSSRIVAEMEQIESKPKEKPSPTTSKKPPVAQTFEQGKIISGQKELNQNPPNVKTSETPYIFDTNLKQDIETQPKSSKSLPKKPIPYRKFTPKNPFGKA